MDKYYSWFIHLHKIGLISFGVESRRGTCYLLESPLHPGGKEEVRVQDQDLQSILLQDFRWVEGNLLPTVGIADSGDV